MPRANSSVPRRKKHKKIIKQAKGYFGTRKSNYRTAKDAIEKIQAGADLVQIYTGFVYEGPSLVKRINKAILKIQ